jgi:hypothetical protein
MLTDWPTSLVQIDDGWAYRVDRDGVDRAKVQAALDAHVPVLPPDRTPNSRKALEVATTVAQIWDALLGKTGPGAEPRRPDGR